MVGPGARVIAANAMAEAIPAIVRPTAFGRMMLVDGFADGDFKIAFDQIAKGTSKAKLSIPVPASDFHGPQLVHLVPIRGVANDIFVGCQVLVVIVPVDRGSSANPALLQGLFDLTPAEARLTADISCGRSILEIAQRTGLSRHTLRVQLRAVMAKTGTRRQSELTSLISGIS